MKLRRELNILTALALCLAICLGLAGCGKDTEETGYRVLDTIDCGSYAIAFRAGDTVLRDYVDAAISTLAAAGNVHQIALTWFTDDPTKVEGDKEALTKLLDKLELEMPPERDLIIGVCEDMKPMAFKTADGGYDGFDVDLAEMVCSVLGWRLIVQSISAADVKLELKSGNIDCAWGGMSFDTSSTDYCLSQGYMPCRYRIITTISSGIKRKSSLSGKVLGQMQTSGALSALKNEGFYDKLADKVDCGSVAESFMNLRSGKCDAIFVDAYAAAYYM